MNQSFLTASLLALFALSPLQGRTAPASNILPPDVPARHWAAGSVKRVLHEQIMGQQADGRFRGDQTVTRYELAVTLDRFVRYIEAARKPLHVQAYPAAIPTAAKQSPAVRKALTHLVSNGFLPMESPLVTQDGSKLVTAKELTDALAAVTIRLSDRAEEPDKD